MTFWDFIAVAFLVAAGLSLRPAGPIATILLGAMGAIVAWLG
ncbi:hypothetical protein FIU89_11065 [Roseovarius sp. THAF27]|nr:hypothetical protein [Roseovarius sp. THAF27]QFT81149.1 hypothetical protein FIU89_11065 [Roseovarius sp. THAF27]